MKFALGICCGVIAGTTGDALGRPLWWSVCFGFVLALAVAISCEAIKKARP